MTNQEPTQPTQPTEPTPTNQDDSNDNQAFINKLKSLFGGKKEEPVVPANDLTLENVMNKLSALEKQQELMNNLKKTNVDFNTMDAYAKLVAEQFDALKNSFETEKANMKTEFETKLNEMKESFNKNSGRLSGVNPYLYNDKSNKIANEEPKRLKYN